MKIETLFEPLIKPILVQTHEIDFGANYSFLIKNFNLSQNLYPNEVYNKLKKHVNYIYDYRSYHFGFFISNNCFYSFCGLYSMKHVYFNQNRMNQKQKTALIGHAYTPSKSLFIDIDKSSNRFESIFIQESHCDVKKDERIYIAQNIIELITNLQFYLVGETDNFKIL